MKRRELQRSGRPASDLLEEAVRLLRAAPPAAWLAYFAGTVPGMLGALYFLSDMSRSAYAAERLVQSSVAMGTVWLWMKCCQAVFTCRLRSELLLLDPPRWTAARLARLAVAQIAIQPIGLIARLIALQLVIPYIWTATFFQNVTVLGDGGHGGLWDLCRRAYAQTVRWPLQLHLAAALLKVFGFFVWLNIVIAMFAAPQIGKMFSGIETQFTQNPYGLINPTFFAASFAALYLCLDPLRKALNVLRCFYGSSLRTGEDLDVQLKAVRRAATLAAGVLLFLGTLAPVPAHAAMREEPKVSSTELSQSLDDVLERREYAWRAPRDLTAQAEDKSWFGKLRKDFGAWVEGVVIKTKRWFGDKGREIRDVAIRDAFPIFWPASKKKFGVVRITVTTDVGQSTYQHFLKDEDTLTDALEDAEFLRGLADAWVRGVVVNRDGSRWILESESKTPLVVPPNAPITVSPTEQTNSSVIMNREAILKLFRKLEPGVHPDVEVTRFLTIERKFVHVPVLLGTIRFEDKESITVAGMLQEYVQGATDGWSYALERLKDYFVTSTNGDLPFEEDAKQLGRVIRAMHETLASGDAGSDFDLRPAGADDIRRWERSAQQTVYHALEAVEHALEEKKLRDDAADEARAIQEGGTRILARIRELAGSISADAGANTRTHGDLHLGQTLRSAAAQFLVIDFEGEPTRPLRERRERNSPLRDVAGMLRSFAYAAAVGSRPSAVGAKSAESREQRAESMDRWEQTVRAAFLRGYFSETKGQPGLLPRSRENADGLITLFELEKSFYELQYELAHRPDWVWIPLRGIKRLVA